MNPSEMQGRLDHGADNRSQSSSCRWETNYTYRFNGLRTSWLDDVTKRSWIAEWRAEIDRLIPTAAC